MKIEFYNSEGEKIRVEILDTDDYWEACEIGHTYLEEHRIEGAEDFHLPED